MKKTVPTLILLIAAISAGTVYFFNDNADTSPISVQANSQQDTEVDGSSQRDFFDYTLSSLGEQELDQIKARVEKNDFVTNGVTLDPVLFDRFLKYKQALTSLNPITTLKLTYLDLEQFHQQIMALQQHYFSEEQIQMLFEEENRLRQLSIEKLLIKSEHLDTPTQLQKWREALADQPEYIQKSARNNELLISLTQSSQLDLQLKHLTRVELVGEVVAGQLLDLDNQHQQFSAQFDGYLIERRTVIADPALTDEDKKGHIDALRQQYFASSQQRRVQALERIHDNGH
ncbi:lipase secretion chaperone [Vibrio ostreicida]|uniref:Lipase chaperone n=1 Tax=Vibrio ostreicida TaxID=526588 RepID=A0ABT8BS17_9VIBR|nr:lipase secretion chaperone [Vibrio ostreicida]MDN3609723.1 lipase secretion chaperone [Vibrio ostreicida]NPD09447.1 lipase chaperone [Vibrio ostreicida]